MNFEQMADNLMLDLEDFKDLVRFFLKVTGEDLARLDSAYDSADLAGATAAAHSIKGAAANLGFQAVADVAANIERLTRSGDASTVISGGEKILDLLNEIRSEL